MENLKTQEKPRTLGSLFVDENNRISDEGLIDYAYKLSMIFKKIGIFAKDPFVSIDQVGVGTEGCRRHEL